MTPRERCLRERFGFVVRPQPLFFNGVANVAIAHLDVRHSRKTRDRFPQAACGVESVRHPDCASPPIDPTSLFRNVPAASSRNLETAVGPAIACWLETHPTQLGLPLAAGSSILSTLSAWNRHQQGAAHVRCPFRKFVSAPALRETRAVTLGGGSQRLSDRVSVSLRRVIDRLLGAARPLIISATPTTVTRELFGVDDAPERT